MISLALALLTACAVGTVYLVQQRQYGVQRMRHTAWHNLWAGLLVMEQEIRKAGYDPEDSGMFGITDVRRYSLIEANALDMLGQPVLFYTYDADENGGLDERNKARNREHPKFRISDVHRNGLVCLTWDNGSGRRPLAETIEAMGFAFALDKDQDGRLDTTGKEKKLIWAVDSDNDNLLDTNIDANNDGRLDAKDDVNGDGRIDWSDGGRLQEPVTLEAIRVVRIWLMARTERPVDGLTDSRKYAVGDRVYRAAADGFGRFVISSSVVCRNL